MRIITAEKLPGISLNIHTVTAGFNLRAEAKLPLQAANFPWL